MRKKEVNKSHIKIEGGKMKKIFKNKTGITLIALIITIITLLILAGITVTMLTGESGILNKAAEAKVATERAEIIESARLEILAKQAENVGTITNKEIAEILENYGELSGEITSEGVNLVTEQGYIIPVSEIWKVEIAEEETPTLPSTEESTPYLPSEEFTQLEGTDLNTGLVIQDNLGNQYVWIEVPRTTEVYQTAGLEITEGEDGKFTEEEYTTIEEDLHTYTATYRNGTSYVDEYYSDEATGLTETEYNELKEKMLQSVYTNGGFWIGRYETGIEESFRTENVTPTETPVIKQNAYPYNFVTCSEAQELASSMNSGNYTSSLMFGVQWDLVLKYLETKGTSVEDLNEDSTSWGNYMNATFTLDRGKYAKYGTLSTWYDYTDDLESCVIGSVKQSATSSSNSILLTTGASDVTSKQNISNLAGNVREWTLEYTSKTSNPCAVRGGNYNFYGSLNPASYRNSYGTTNSNYPIGIRVSLY